MLIQYARIAAGDLHSKSDRLPVVQLGDDFVLQVGALTFPVDAHAISAFADPGSNEVEVFVKACDVDWNVDIAYALKSVGSARTSESHILFCLDWSSPEGDSSTLQNIRDLAIVFDEFPHRTYVVSNDEQMIVEMGRNQPLWFTRTWSTRSGSGWTKYTQRCALVFTSKGVALRMEDTQEVSNANRYPLATAGGKGSSNASGKKKSTELVPFIDSNDREEVEGKVTNKVKFDDVVGQDKAKKVLRQLVGYIAGFRRLQEMRAEIPRGILLFGDGGNGKTMLARALANEAGVPFFRQDPSVLLSRGAEAVRMMFENAQKEAESKQSPVIIFMDEIDVIGQERPKGGASQFEQHRIEVLNALLAGMDGFEKFEYPVIIVGTSNREESLDESLLRDGRFDRKIYLSNPKQHEMVQLLEMYSLNFELDFHVDLNAVAKKIAGLPASSAKRVCNDAALMQFDRDPHGDLALEISQEMLLEAAAEAISEHIGKSKGKRFIPADDSLKLVDVIGQQSAKDDVQDIINFLRDPQRFIDAGVDIPRGLLLTGGPGLGKTLLARAVAAEAGVPFFSVSGSDFVEKYVGVGAGRVRELFAEARRNAPCILFIDEVDGVGKKRSEDGGGGNSERDQTLNQLLVELDGFGQQKEPIVVLAATNLKKSLDPALVRPGRLDREAAFEVPNVDDRIALFEYYTRGKKLAKGVKLESFARNTFGFSGAEVAAVCNEAALMMVRQGGTEVTAKLLDAAITRVTVGAPRKHGNVTKEDLRNTAVHETGHALVSILSGGRGIARITVLAAGESLGHVAYMNDDRHSATKEDMLSRITSALAGRAATELVLSCIDTGPSSDFETARSVAYKMVTEYGMSELGPINEIKGVERSNKEQRAIEKVVRGILAECDQRARDLINENRAQFDKLVTTLLRKETILGEEFEAIVAGRRYRGKSSAAVTSRPRSTGGTRGAGVARGARTTRPAAAAGAGAAPAGA